MNLNDLTIGQLKDLVTALNGSQAHPFTLGEAYLIRTVTHYYTGRLVAVFDKEIVLNEGAWIADTGRYHDAITKGTLSEVEPIVGEFIIGRGAIIDVVKWPNNIQLPKDQK